jgi:hypothetical protein
MMKSALTICELPPENLDAQLIIRSSSPNCVFRFLRLLSLTQGGITQVNQRRLLPLLAAAALLCATAAQAEPHNSKIKHVLLISVDGMHAVDFMNCANGISTANNGTPYCPAIAALGKTGLNYVAASTSKPSDSFPGLTAIITGGSPALTGVYYDVSYSRNYDAPAKRRGRPLHPRCTTHGHDG